MPRRTVNRSRGGDKPDNTKPVWIRLGGVWSTKNPSIQSLILHYYEGKKGNRLTEDQMNGIFDTMFDTEGKGLRLMIRENTDKERGSKVPDYHVILNANDLELEE